MSAADGRVVGTTKLVDHGAASRRWNLVILAEGYQEAELPKFRTDCNTFIDRLFQATPFNELWCALNIYAVEVASTDSGADDPGTCGDGTTGSGATARTFFDATFCFNGLRRLLVGDQALALGTAQAQVPEVHAALVLVNSAQYGGAGGGVAWFSTHPDSAEIGIHELGHSAFSLTDEYADAQDSWPGGEPAAPNATAITDRATTKWAARIRPETPLPTTSNPDCTTEDNQPSPVPAGTVGLFEGADRTRCGVFRPEHNCKMRVLGQPFCAVCRDVIRSTLRPFLPRTLAATTGVQFAGTLQAGETRRWFSYDWPACWHVVWSVVPRSIGEPGPDVRWRVQVERASRERITYWINVTNLESRAVDVEGRYAILAKE